MGDHGNDYVWSNVWFDKGTPPQRGFAVSESGCPWIFAGHYAVWSGPKTPNTSGFHIVGRAGAGMANAMVMELATIDGLQITHDSPLPTASGGMDYNTPPAPPVPGKPPVHGVCAATIPNFKDVSEFHWHGCLIVGDNPYALVPPRAAMTVVTKGVQVDWAESAPPPASPQPVKWVSVKFAGDPQEYRMPVCL